MHQLSLKHLAGASSRELLSHFHDLYPHVPTTVIPDPEIQPSSFSPPAGTWTIVAVFPRSGYIQLQWSARLKTKTHAAHASPTLHLPPAARAGSLLVHAIQSRSQSPEENTHLIYAQPPVEVPCFLFQVAADLCFEDQTTLTTQGSGSGVAPQLKGKHKDRIDVLGIVTLQDIDMFKGESRTGYSRIACTTNAMFLEKPLAIRPGHLLNLLRIHRAPVRPCPGLQLAIKEPYARRPTYHLSTGGSTWSDTELDRILHLDADRNGVAHHPRSGRGRTGGACTRACASSARGSAPAYGTAAVPVDRGSGRGPDPGGNGPGAAARTETGRRALYRPHDDDSDAGKYSFGDGDEAEDGAVPTRFLLSRGLATVLQPAASSLPDARLTPHDFLMLVLGSLSSRSDACFIEWFAEDLPLTHAHLWFALEVIITHDSEAGFGPKKITRLDQWLIRMGTTDELPNAPESPASKNFETIAISVHASAMAGPGGAYIVLAATLYSSLNLRSPGA
ncbi:hypothetical protein EDB89DRAFT_2231797 [Lactarius sanguifluus]|nr:hypothetical protein EDB89DRAFT_2231797 [Lactarius sanguifluus]